MCSSLLIESARLEVPFLRTQRHFSLSPVFSLQNHSLCSFPHDLTFLTEPPSSSLILWMFTVNSLDAFLSNGLCIEGETWAPSVLVSVSPGEVCCSFHSFHICVLSPFFFLPLFWEIFSILSPQPSTYVDMFLMLRVFLSLILPVCSLTRAHDALVYFMSLLSFFILRDTDEDGSFKDFIFILKLCMYVLR